MSANHRDAGRCEADDDRDFPDPSRLGSDRCFGRMSQHPATRRRATIRQRVSWEAQLLIAVLAFVGAVVAVFRVTIPHTQPLAVGAAPGAATPEFERVLSAYTRVALEPGNKVELLLNGDGTYPRLWRDLRRARRSITIQSYYAQPGAMADTLREILVAQSRRGIKVRLLLDAFGAAPLPERWRDALRKGGVEVATLRPMHWHSMHGAADRSHVRVVVVDGRIAYTGGFGLADYWSADHNGRSWRETNVRLEGPVADQFQSVFGTAWH